MSLGRNSTRRWPPPASPTWPTGSCGSPCPLLAVQLTRSPLLIAGVTVAARPPWLLLSLVAGALADRLDRRQTMIRVNLVRTVLLGGLALAVAADLATLPMLYAVAVLLGMAETLFDTSAQSLLPAIVDRDDLTRANSRLFAVELVANTSSARPSAACWPRPAWPSPLACPRPPTWSGPAAWPCSAAASGPPGPGRRGRPGSGTRSPRAPASSGATRCCGRWPSCSASRTWPSAPPSRCSCLFAVAPGPMGLSEAGYGVLTATLGVGSLLGSLAGRPGRAAPRPGQHPGPQYRPERVTLAVPVVTTLPVPIGASMVASGAGIVLWNVITVSLRQRITPTGCSAG